MEESKRARTLRAHGAGDDELDELLSYTENQFQALREQHKPPLADEECVSAWRAYAAVAAEIGVFGCLRECLVQLRFPIAEGVSESTLYRAATRRGQLTDEVSEQPGLSLSRPDELELLLHPTPAGTVAIIEIEAREDFVALVQTFIYRNEPRPVPDAVGAMIISGYNNWDRVRTHRQAWEAEQPGRAGDDLAWSMEFKSLIPRKELYQDTFILLTRGPYSGIAASALGLSEDEWRRKSLIIRREHECTHYFTRRVFGSMANSLHDELIADFMGIVAATGVFRSDWFLRFMGLESFPQVRADGRVHQYRGKTPLSDEAFHVLQSVLCAAARNLEAADLSTAATPWEIGERTAVLCGLSQMSLEELAADDGIERIQALCRVKL